MPPEFVLRARKRFCDWLRWYIATHPDTAPTSAALARQMGIGKAGLHKLLEPGSQRVPDLRTILAAEKVLGFPVNVLLHSDPPAVPPRR